MDAISQTTFWSAFSWMKMFEFRLKFHWILFLRVQLTIFQHWFRQWLGAVQAISHFLIQLWLDYRRIYASFGFNELNRKRACRLHHKFQRNRRHWHQPERIWFPWKGLNLNVELPFILFAGIRLNASEFLIFTVLRVKDLHNWYRQFKVTAH